MRVAYNKLVRDQIPDIIAAAGSQPSTRILDHASYRDALRSNCWKRRGKQRRQRMGS
jgi:predicted house-cleaning noncanonical NTP pyrophosphatase (MazG superfamily)